MTVFRVGMRVKVVRADLGSKLRGLVNGDVGVIARMGTHVDFCLDVDGKVSASNCYGQFPVFRDEIEPILYDGNQTVSWEECEWIPPEMRESVR